MRNAVMLVCVAVLLGLTGCTQTAGASMDVDTLRPYVATYVDLLQEQDESALRLHLRNAAHAPDDAQRRLATDGGKGWRLDGVSWTQVTSHDVDVVIGVTGPRGRRQWRQLIHWSHGHWQMSPLPTPPLPS
ncbi:hypothetical protein OG394_13235 [Kribbella sp. NBC_01245]|uniref:hypothetical protein n=1 Tax=Kribbella sp. NBC_01245 TaxID=2903578 RepID=UPI002E290E72|nr:hypothetical protein [Kribbella sp. NBC_01245]